MNILALCETPWNNTCFFNPVDFCDDNIDLFVLQTRESEKQNIGVGLHKTVSEKQNIGVGLHKIVYEYKDTPVIIDIHDSTKLQNQKMIKLTKYRKQ